MASGAGFPRFAEELLTPHLRQLKLGIESDAGQLGCEKCLHWCECGKIQVNSLRTSWFLTTEDTWSKKYDDLTRTYRVSAPQSLKSADKSIFHCNNCVRIHQIIIFP